MKLIIAFAIGVVFVEVCYVNKNVAATKEKEEISTQK